MSEVPNTDMREALWNEFHDVPKDFELEYQAEFDPRFLDNLGVKLEPWTFDEVPVTQKIKCHLGFHRGRIEVLGGSSCFFCSYCGEIVR